VIRGILAGFSLATGVLLTGQASIAMPAAPDLAASAQNSPIEDVGWRCGGKSCWWFDNYWGPVPNYALGWGPPHRPGCYWKQGLLGNWKYKC
jgi:hypothetical protein